MTQGWLSRAQRAWESCQWNGCKTLLFFCLMLVSSSGVSPQAVWPPTSFVVQAPTAFARRSSADPDDPSNYFHAATACAVQGQAASAIEHLQAGITATRGNVTAEYRWMLGELLLSVGNTSQAIEQVAAGLRSSPTHPKYWEMLALAYEETGEFRVAERIYAVASRLASRTNQRSFWQNRVALLQRLGRHAEATKRTAPAVGPPPAARLWPFRASSPDSAWPFAEYGASECLHAYMTPWDKAEAARREPGKGGEGSEEPGPDRTLADDASDAAELDRMLWALQHPPRCSDARAVVVFLQHDEMGLASSVHMLSLALSFALRTNRTLVTASNDTWWLVVTLRRTLHCHAPGPATGPLQHDTKLSSRANRTLCPSAGWECYFEAVGGCRQAEVEGEEALHASGAPQSAAAGRAGLRSAERVVYADWRQQREVLLHPRNRLFVPRGLRPRGLLWFRARLVDRLFKFNPAVARAVASRLDTVQRAAAASSLQGPVLAVHVRRGDKYVESATIRAEAYQTAASRLVERHNVSRVVIASDDAEQVAQLQAWADASRVKVLNAWRDEVRHVGPNNVLALNTHVVDLVTYALTGMVVVEILALGNVFVGTFSSNLSRLAFELARARDRAIAPPCSLDMVWSASP